MPNEDKPTNSGVPAAAAPEEDDDDEEEYVVEKILNHKVTKKGKLEYYLKWKGFSNAENTWEPADNLNCQDLVEQYESAREKKEKKAKTVKTSIEDGVKTSNNVSEEKDKKSKQVKRKTPEESIPKKKKKNEKRTNGFERGMIAEEILGATETSGEVHFLIKWKNVNDAELVPSKIANIKIPQMVIAFYEARLTWSTTSNKSSDETEETEDSQSPKKNGTATAGAGGEADEANPIEPIEDEAAPGVNSISSDNTSTAIAVN